MKLTLQEKLALIYTSAGSQRSIASLVGISHQKIGRLLHSGQPGYPAVSARTLNDPDLVASVDQAFRIHKDLVRQQATVDQLPWSNVVPIFSERMRMKDGVKGDRVQAMNLHWLPDRLKYIWLGDIHQAGRYYAVSVGSIVNLHDYNRLAEALRRGKFRDEEQREHKRSILRELEIGTINSRIQTTYTPFALTSAWSIEHVLADIIGKVKEKHEPASGTAGTAVADRILLQVDTRNGRDQRYRTKHPIAKAKPRKARRNSRRNRSA